ncbi:MAG: zinc-binding dehydrogenase [Candidatus Hydrogenedentes bacterium]|nr:zinc-binding dehydrogenase [Candidatus Hydrogenedentota bacterium]
MLGLWARMWGANRILMADIDDGRLAFAQELGFRDTFNPRTGDVVAWIKDTTQRGADVVFEASGSSAAFEQSVLSARTFGRVVLMGNPSGEMRLSQKAYWAILRNELKVFGTWNSVYSRLPRNEWRLALDAMASGALDLAPLVTHRVSLRELPEAMAAMRDKRVAMNKLMYVHG